MLLRLAKAAVLSFPCASANGCPFEASMKMLLGVLTRSQLRCQVYSCTVPLYKSTFWSRRQLKLQGAQLVEGWQTCCCTMLSNPVLSSRTHLKLLLRGLEGSSGAKPAIVFPNSNSSTGTHLKLLLLGV